MSDRESGGFTFKVEDFPCINKSVQFSSVHILLIVRGLNCSSIRITGLIYDTLT